MKKAAAGKRSAPPKRGRTSRRAATRGDTKVAAIPRGFHSVTPHLTVRGAADAIDSYKRAFWGDRYAKVADPFGHEWGLGTHKQDLSAREIGRRAQEFFSRKEGGS